MAREHAKSPPSPEPTCKRPRGRPASASVDRALMKAALGEFAARGYHAMTMESVAARAGVSKLSLYRRWSSKLALTEELFRLLSEENIPPDCGSLEADLQALARQSLSVATKPRAQLILRTMGEISGNRALMAAYRKYLLAPRMRQLRAVLERARGRGELTVDMPVDIACSMVAGPLFVYYLALLTGFKLDLGSDLPARFTRSILNGIGI